LRFKHQNNIIKKFDVPKFFPYSGCIKPIDKRK